MFSGITIEILELLQRSLNFSMRRVEPEDRQWGGFKVDPETGERQWNGMVQMLIAGEADMSSAGLSMTKERGDVRLHT